MGANVGYVSEGRSTPSLCVVHSPRCDAAMGGHANGNEMVARPRRQKFWVSRSQMPYDHLSLCVRRAHKRRDARCPSLSVA